MHHQSNLSDRLLRSFRRIGQKEQNGEKKNVIIDHDIVRQLSGYARDKKLFKDSPAENIPCLVIYPKESEAENPFKDKPLESFLEKEDNQYWNFYRVAVPLPVLQTPQGN